MPVAMARARITAIFFMAISPFSLVLRLLDQGKDFRDRHHVLELFGKENGSSPSWKETAATITEDA